MTARQPAHPLILTLAAGLTLAGCSRHDGRDDRGDTASIDFSGIDNDMANAGQGRDQTVSVEVPGFTAKLSVPGLSLGSHDTEIDGIPFHPGTRLTGLNVTGDAGDGIGGAGRGTVEMRFTDPAAPDALLAYYRDAAAKGGWTATLPAGGEQFAAIRQQDKGSERLSLRVAAAGTGSTGRFLVSGG